MSKQGLSARLYASNQTPIVVKAELLPVWWFRSSPHFCRKTFRRTSEPKPHWNHGFPVSFRLRSSLRWWPQGQRTSESGHWVYFGCVKRGQVRLGRREHHSAEMQNRPSAGGK